MPSMVVFAPDSLPQGERGRQRRQSLEADVVSGDRAAVIVQNNREPGPGFLPMLIQERDIQERMICLPDLVGSTCFVTHDHVIGFLLGLCPLVRKDNETWVKLLDNLIDLTVT